MIYLKHVFVFFVFLLCVVAQTTLANWISIFDIRPDFLIIFLLHRAFKHGPAVGALWGFFIGFACDLYAPVEYLGANALSMMIVGFIIGQLEERFLTLQFLPKLFVLVVMFLLNDLIYIFITGFEKSELLGLFFAKILPECIYTTLFGGLVFYFLKTKLSQK